LKGKVWWRCFYPLTMPEKDKSGFKNVLIILFDFWVLDWLHSVFGAKSEFIKVLEIFFLVFLGEKKNKI
jgi:hypothetical protein